MLEKVRKRIKDHIKLFNYTITSEQEEDIVTLYELNHQEYDENTLTLHIEKFIQNMGSSQDSDWKMGRRPTIYATKVDIDSLDVPNFYKDEETFNFLISRLGTEIPFCFLSAEQKASLVQSMYPLIIDPGIELIVEGSIGAEMYIVEEGKFDVLAKGKILNELNRGSVFGELALLHGIPRTATVIATQKSKVWSAEQTSFSCIRIRDQMYRRTIAREAIERDKGLMKCIKTTQNLEKILDNYKSSFISAGTPQDLEDDEVVVVLKNAKIIDNEERSVFSKDLIRVSFFAETDLDCVILNLKYIKSK